MKKQIILLLILSIIIISCNSAKKPTHNDDKAAKEVIQLNKETYTITKIKDLDTLIKKPTMTLDFTKNTVSGNGACNQYGGSFTTKNNTIKFGMLRATRMYCESHSKIESSFFEAVSKVTYYKKEGTLIRFFDKENTLLLIGKQV